MYVGHPLHNQPGAHKFRRQQLSQYSYVMQIYSFYSIVCAESAEVNLTRNRAGSIEKYERTLESFTQLE